MRRRMKRLLLVGAFSCHLALVVAGAAHLTSRLHGPVGRGLRFYDALSGAGDSYSFFAPAVGPQLRARFTLSTPQGERSEETLETGKSREVGFRLGNLAGTVYIVAKRTDLRRAFLGALAASRLGAHPEANRVQVNIEEWVMPTMAEYRARGAAAVALVARCHVRAHVEEPTMRSGRYRCMAIDTWFRPVSARPLAGLRVGLPLLLLVHLVWLSNDLLSLHGSRGIIPWELTDLLRDPWVPGLPTLAKAFLPLGISEHTAIILLLSGYAGSLLSLALGFHTRLSAFLAWGLHLSLVTSGFASFYGVDQLANTFLFYLLRLSVRARLDVRVSSGLLPPRGNDSRRLSEGDASPPLRDLSRRRSRQGNGETVVERRGHLAGGLSARLQHFRSQLAGEASLDPNARGLGHVGGGDRLRVSHLATPHPQGCGASRRSDCTWASACSWGSSSSRA